MKTHLQPITARVTSTIKKSSDCGCSPAKLDPGTIMKGVQMVSKVAGSLKGGDKKSEGGSQSAPGSISQGYSGTGEEAAPAKSLAYAAKKAANRGDKTFEYAGQTFNTTAKADSAVKKYSAIKKHCY
jgi:hypothetical protein